MASTIFPPAFHVRVPFGKLPCFEPYISGNFFAKFQFKIVSDSKGEGPDFVVNQEDFEVTLVSDYSGTNVAELKEFCKVCQLASTGKKNY